MKTLRSVVLGATALLIIGWAVPASAHHMDNDGYGNGYGYNNNYDGNDDEDYYAQIQRHVRACRQHQREHQALREEHQDSHEGYYNQDDHQDTHEALDEEHEQYHANHPGAQNCGYWLNQSRRYQGDGYRWR